MKPIAAAVPKILTCVQSVRGGGRTLLSNVSKFLLSFGVSLLIAGRGFRIALRHRPGGVQNGPWQTDLALSSGKASIYTRAAAARNTPLALRSSEALYFVAHTDSAGNELRRGRTYSIIGRDPEARWWSVAAYNNNHLIPNPRHRYSYSRNSVRREADGRWTIRFSPREQRENWLPGSTEDGRLKLVLRCYDPAPRLLENPGGAELPVIASGIF
jgi:hypothetical protein